MCKLFGVVGIQSSEKEVQEKALTFLGAAKGLMTATDKDGYGYATFRQAGGRWGVYGEKWVDPTFAFMDPKRVREEEKIYKDGLGLAVEIPEGRAACSMGDPNPRLPIRSMIAHARQATCAVNVENTHPFYDETNKVILIHNGVISNDDTIKKYQSTCDSEAILTAYVEEGVAENPKKLQKMVDRLSGSFACFVMAYDGKKWVVDVFKNAAPSLYTCFVPELGAYAFATTTNILRGGLKVAKLESNSLFPIRDNAHVRLDAGTGEKLFDQQFKYTPIVIYSNGSYGGTTTFHRKGRRDPYVRYDNYGYERY